MTVFSTYLFYLVETTYVVHTYILRNMFSEHTWVFCTRTLILACDSDRKRSLFSLSSVKVRERSRTYGSDIFEFHEGSKLRAGVNALFDVKEGCHRAVRRSRRIMWGRLVWLALREAPAQVTTSCTLLYGTPYNPSTLNRTEFRNIRRN